MRIGINGSSLIALASPIGDIADHAAVAEADGFATYWVAQLAWPDALTTLAVVGQSTTTIELGTAVIPTWPRHPLMLAGQALSVQSVTGNRLLLGIGLAHQSSVESTYKIPFERPAAHMREYLDVMLPAMSERRVDARGDIWSGEVEHVAVAEGTEAPEVMLAAMGPQMLRLAGSRTAGSVLWLSGPRVIESHIGPTLRKAASEAGRGEPRIAASVPVCVTDDAEAARGAIAAVLDGYNDLPSYRGVMDQEGVEGPADVSLVGDEAAVRSGLGRFADAGTTDFSALEFPTSAQDAARTRALLKDVVAQ